MSTETLPELKKVLLNEDGQTALALRFRALFSLKDMGEKGDNGAIDIIAEGFKDDSELLKHELAYVLGQTKNFHAVKPLQGVLADTNQQAMVRHEAAEALGALGDKGSVAMLQDYFENDPLEVIRETCELALERIKWENSEAAKTETLQKSAYTSIDPAPPLPTDQAEGSDKATVEKLQKTLMDKSQSLFHRYRAMFRLRDIGTEDAVLALATGFDDSSALFRHEIAYVFGQMSDPASVPALIKVLGKTEEEGMVRHEAAEALGSIATDDVLPILKKFAEDKDQVVRESAIVALDMYEYENSNEVEYAH